MDSGGTNSSGSMQSSSGGDDQEFDSRPHHHHHHDPSSSLSSAFFISPSNNNNNNNNIMNFGNSLLSHHHQPPPPQPQQPTPPTTFFDPLSNNYLHNLSDQSQLNSIHLDLVHSSSKTLRSASDQPPPSSFNLGPPFPRLNTHDRRNIPRSDHGNPTNPVSNKNPKKRTRASRRAPTTVLTTDTSNFRQMVQEFTGIPAPPFSATASSSSPFARRFDLFGSGSSAVKQPPSRHMEPLLGPGGPHLLFNPLRPNISQTNPLFLSSSNSSMADSGPAFTSNNYNLISDLQQNPPPSSFQGLNMRHGVYNHVNNESLNFMGGLQHEASGNNNGNSSRRVMLTDKSNYSASALTDFHGHGRGGSMENVGSKGTEGHLDSWICPSQD